MRTIDCLRDGGLRFKNLVYEIPKKLGSKNEEYPLLIECCCYENNNNCCCCACCGCHMGSGCMASGHVAPCHSPCHMAPCHMAPCHMASSHIVEPLGPCHIVESLGPNNTGPIVDSLDRGHAEIEPLTMGLNNNNNNDNMVQRVSKTPSLASLPSMEQHQSQPQPQSQPQAEPQSQPLLSQPQHYYKVYRQPEQQNCCCCRHL